MKSILETAGGERHCQFCGSVRDLETHHVFGGANRRKSDQYGLCLTLCRRCHNEPPMGVHYNAQVMFALRKAAQAKAMEVYGWSAADFIRLFGRNYLD